MAAWTRSETNDRITFARADGEAAYIVHKSGTHWHAEQWFPYAEDGMGRSDAATIADWYQSTIEAQGETVT